MTFQKPTLITANAITLLIFWISLKVCYYLKRAWS